MDLPSGKSCADCLHCDRCSAIFGHIPADEVCDWSPSRFAASKTEEVPVAEDHLILSVKNSPGIYGRALWYRPDCRGYTEDVSVAGRYTQAEAEAKTRLSGLDLLAVPVSVAEEMSQPSVSMDDVLELVRAAKGEEVSRG